MLKLQYVGTSRSLWLVGPKMKIGSASGSEVLIGQEDAAALHAIIHVNGDELLIEPVDNHQVYINEKLAEGTSSLSVNDLIRVGTKEMTIVDPKKQSAKPSSKESPPSSADATVFRAAIDPGTAAAVIQQASGWILQGIHKTIRNKRYPVDGTMVLGRSQECDLHFPFDRLSRKHAELKVIDGILFVKDLDSSNGTFHNGEKISQAKVHPGDALSFDKLEFTVIGPQVSTSSASAVGDFKAGQTVVRSAITPEMIKQAGKETATQGAAHANGKGLENKNPVLLAVVAAVAVAVVVLGIMITLI